MVRHNLIRARQAKGFRQEDVAREVGVTKATISKYESGQTESSQAVWEKLAVLFEKPVEHLWRLTE